MLVAHLAGTTLCFVFTWNSKSFTCRTLRLADLALAGFNLHIVPLLSGTKSGVKWLMTLVFYLSTISYIVLLIISYHSSSHLTIACLMWSLIMLCSISWLFSYIASYDVSCCIWYPWSCTISHMTYVPSSNFHVASFTPFIENENETLPSIHLLNFDGQKIRQNLPPRGFQCKSFPNSPPLFGGIDFMTISKPRGGFKGNPGIFRNFAGIQNANLRSSIPKFLQSQRNTRGSEVWPSERSVPSSTCRNLRKLPFKMLEFGSQNIWTSTLLPIKNQFLLPTPQNTRDKWCKTSSPFNWLPDSKTPRYKFAARPCVFAAPMAFSWQNCVDKGVLWGKQKFWCSLIHHLFSLHHLKVQLCFVWSILPN